MTLCMHLGVLFFASQQNGAQQVNQLQANSVSVDITAQLEASDNAEVQKKECDSNFTMGPKRNAQSVFCRKHKI